MSNRLRGIGEEPSPVIMTLNDEVWYWNDLEHFLQLNLNSLPEEVEDVNDADAWLSLQIDAWLDHERLVKAALNDQVKVSDEAYANWQKLFGVSLNRTIMEASLQERGLTRAQWESYQKERLLTRTWAAQHWHVDDRNMETEARTYYNSHVEAFTRPESIRIRHLVNASREKVVALRRRIVAGENFAKLAIEYSESPDRLNGGDMGDVSRGQLPDSLEDVCFRLEVGELSPVVPSEYGYHLFKVIDRTGPSLIPFSSVKGEIEQKLRNEVVEKSMEQWLQQEREPYKKALQGSRIRKQFTQFLKRIRHDAS